VSPTPQTYENLPDWAAPRPSQLVTQHAVWIDQIPWGKLRDRIINNQEVYATDEFRHLFMVSLSVNWPYRPMDALVYQGDEVVMNPVFERHVNRLENWSLGPEFANRYPELQDVARLEFK
jgi:hypothetical protein